MIFLCVCKNCKDIQQLKKKIIFVEKPIKIIVLHRIISKTIYH